MSQQPPNSQPPSSHIHWNEEGQPISTTYNDVYFSKDDGIAETHYVFLDGNRLSERWQQNDSNNHSAHKLFTIAETGFGTGLNLPFYQNIEQEGITL